MNAKGGYWGKIAWINLTTGKVSYVEIDEEFEKTWIGGAGLGTKLLWDHYPAWADPLGPRNLLIFATGPYQAAPITGTGRCTAVFISPLTMHYGESIAGGHIGPILKQAGVDAVVLAGKASKPVYVYVEEGKAEIRDASAYWGMDAVEVVDAIKKDVGGRRLTVTAIGQAGENLVRYAAIVNDKHGVFGRCGGGAVMGSKNVKALVANGTMTPPLADRDGLLKYYREDLLPRINKAEFTKTNAELGQVAAVVPREENGLLPIKNFGGDEWEEGAKLIGTPRFNEVLNPKRWPCEYCVMGCHRKITTEGYPQESGGPEYETAAMIGSNLLIDDLKAVVVANDLCNRYGIDTIELGGVLGWAFESYEKGYLTKEDTDGIELKWGSGEALIEMTKKIAFREGIGDLLAEGLRSCVWKYPETKEWAVEAQGMAVPAHDPRAFFSMVIADTLSLRGPSHCHGFSEAQELGVTLPELGYPEPMDRFAIEKKGEIGAVYQDVHEFWNSLVWCFFYFFSNWPFGDTVKVMNLITGWDMSPVEAKLSGERMSNLQQALNLRCGLDPKRDFVVPERLRKPHKKGGAAGKVLPWEYIIEEYYKTREWKDGIPTRKKLIELGLADAAKEIYGY